MLWYLAINGFAHFSFSFVQCLLVVYMEIEGNDLFFIFSFFFNTQQKQQKQTEQQQRH